MLDIYHWEPNANSGKPLLMLQLMAEHPNCGRWSARMEARPAVQQSLAVGNWQHPETAFAPGPEHARWG